MRWILIIVVVIVGLVLAGKTWRALEGHSLAVADQLELGATYDRWLEAGQPAGSKLVEFMKGRRSDLVASNRSFTIGGTNFTTQFAFTQSKSGQAGTLFVTTNRLTIWLGDSGLPKLVSH